MDPHTYRQLLLDRAQTIKELKQLAESSCDTVTLDQTRVGRLSRMDAMQSQAMNQEAQRRRDIELRDIGAALRRIETDEFGNCEECGELINEARIAINPTVRWCIDCASARE